MADDPHVGIRSDFEPSEIGAIAHLYRGEVYRSTIWRTRLDNTTNWAVVTTGIALSATFSSRDASPLPMVLVGLLVLGFLMLEARRYRYFYLWRMRARIIETEFFAMMLVQPGTMHRANWSRVLAEDYLHPQFHVPYAVAVGRRLRSNYAWLLMVQAVGYYGKLAIHPYPLTDIIEVYDRAAIGPIPGQVVVLAGILFHASWITFALWTLSRDRRRRHDGHRLIDSMV